MKNICIARERSWLHLSRISYLVHSGKWITEEMERSVGDALYNCQLVYEIYVGVLMDTIFLFLKNVHPLRMTRQILIIRC